MRQHVNPLSRFFQLPLKLPNIEELYDDFSLPLHLDIGSARGKFLLNLASTKQDWNYLGLEIRRPLVKAAEQDIKLLGLSNIRFLFCNANVSLPDWLVDLPTDRLQCVSIQFPDPWFKRRHQKRRVLQPSLLMSLAKALQPGRELFIQSDVISVIKPMVMLINMSSCFTPSSHHNGQWLDSNPFGIHTEREEYSMQRDFPIYRAQYLRNKKNFPTLSVLEEAYRKWELSYN